MMSSAGVTGDNVSLQNNVIKILSRLKPLSAAFIHCHCQIPQERLDILMFLRCATKIVVRLLFGPVEIPPITKQNAVNVQLAHIGSCSISLENGHFQDY